MVRAVITDITRMSGQNICVGAITTKNAQIRLNTPNPTRATFDGLDIATSIEVDWDASHVSPPHTEDGSWSILSLQPYQPVSGTAFRELIQSIHYGTSVEELYGQVFEKAQNGNVGFKPGQGDCSLTTMAADRVTFVDAGDHVRISIPGGISTRIEDLRVHEHQAGCQECQRSLLSVLARTYSGRRVFLRLGLSRPFSRMTGSPQACWLQVNHVIPMDEPLDGHYRNIP